MVSVMAKKKKQNTLVRVHERVKHAFKQAVGALELTEVAIYRDKPPNLETTTEALYFWFASKTSDEAEAFLAEQFGKLNHHLGQATPMGSASPDAPKVEIVDIPIPVKRRARK